MAHNVNFFDPTDVLGSNWVVQSRSPSTSINRAQGLDAYGDEEVSHTYGAQKSDTITYKYFGSEGINFDSVYPGLVHSGWHVDSVSVKYSPTDYPEISVSAHYHEGTETGITSHGSEHRSFKPSIHLPAGFGCPTLLASAFGVSEAGIGISSFSYDASITHQDEVGATGNYLASDNRDGNESVTIEFVGVPATTPHNDNWDMTASSTPTSNTAADTSSYTFEHHMLTRGGGGATE